MPNITWINRTIASPADIPADLNDLADTVSDAFDDVGRGAKVKGATAQSIPHGVSTTLTWDTVSYNDGGGYANNAFVAQEDGTYIVSCSIQYGATANSVGHRELALKGPDGTEAVSLVPGVPYAGLSACAIVRLTAGQGVYATTTHTGGSGVNLTVTKLHLAGARLR